MALHTPRLISTDAERLFGEIAESRQRRRERFESDMARIDSEYDCRIDRLRHPGRMSLVYRAVLYAWALLVLVILAIGLFG
ncbi:hypothetical protein [Aeoliella sp.]|uniref:hypothetical protein n=1 Tax=Aeoliella sp. TaxID=2795800 RepID=UPI003CCBB36E